MKAIPPEDYKGAVWMWTVELAEMGYSKQLETMWYGDIEITDDEYEKLLNKCENS